MLTSVRSLMAATALAGAFWPRLPALAQDRSEEATPPVTVTGSVTVSPITASAASACRAATSPSRAVST